MFAYLPFFILFENNIKVEKVNFSNQFGYTFQVFFFNQTREKKRLLIITLYKKFIWKISKMQL